MSESGSEIAIPQPARSRSASRAREALSIPANVLAELDETKLFELKEVNSIESQLQWNYYGTFTTPIF